MQNLIQYSCRLISVDFDVLDEVVIRYSAFVRYWRKDLSLMWHCISYLDFERACDLIRTDMLYNIVTSS
jgi:hypothetical protein